jgi:hypothetical protein
MSDEQEGSEAQGHEGGEGEGQKFEREVGGDESYGEQAQPTPGT